jgi:antitoxin HigA-1
MSTWSTITERQTVTKRREPTSPGEILQEEFLTPLGLTQKQLADHIGCDVKVVNRIVNRRAAVTAEMALKLGAALRTTPEFWLNAQKAVDLHRAAARIGPLPRSLRAAG